MIEKLFAIVDMGTTNTRLTLIDTSGKVYASEKGEFGVKDCAAAGRKEILINGLNRLLTEVIQHQGLSLSKIERMICSGMITSDIGLIDIPHCTAPIDVNELAAHTIEMSLPEILPAPVIFIPGVKNQVEHSSLESLEEMDFMRGEETQVFGAIELYGIEAPATFMFLSSHTKVIDVDEKYRITRSFTMLSGQIFNALRFHSFLASSIPKENPTCIHIRLSINEKVNLSLALEEFFGCNRVDLVILDEADPFLAAEVIRGERLFARDEYEADEYDLYILRRAGDLAPLERERMALILGEET